MNCVNCNQKLNTNSISERDFICPNIKNCRIAKERIHCSFNFDEYYKNIIKVFYVSVIINDVIYRLIQENKIMHIYDFRIRKDYLLFKFKYDEMFKVSTFTEQINKLSNRVEKLFLLK